MKINKLGNTHSDVIGNFVKSAASNKPTPSKQFSDIVSGIFAQDKPKTLRDVLAQLDFESDTVDPAESAMGSPEMGGMPGEEDLGGDMGMEEETPDVNEDAKRGIIDALIALCGGVEEAKQCLDQHGGGMDPMGDMGEDPMGEEMPDPMGVGSDMDPGMEEMDSGPSDMAAPMPMQSPAPKPMPGPIV